MPKFERKELLAKFNKMKADGIPIVGAVPVPACLQSVKKKVALTL